MLLASSWNFGSGEGVCPLPLPLTFGSRRDHFSSFGTSDHFFHIYQVRRVFRQAQSSSVLPGNLWCTCSLGLPSLFTYLAGCGWSRSCLLRSAMCLSSTTILVEVINPVSHSSMSLSKWLRRLISLPTPQLFEMLHLLEWVWVLIIRCLLAGCPGCSNWCVMPEGATQGCWQMVTTRLRH